MALPDDAVFELERGIGVLRPSEVTRVKGAVVEAPWDLDVVHVPLIRRLAAWLPAAAGACLHQRTRRRDAQRWRSARTTGLT